MPANLLLHCGAHAVPRAELVSVPTPSATRTWQPIPHQRLLTQIEDALPAHGLRVVQEAHALTHDGARYFGLLEVVNGSASDEYTWVLGLRNSHDKRFPAGLVLGAQVFVCDNLAFSGEISVARKHTRYVTRDLPILIEQAVEQLRSRWHDQDHRIEAYKERRVTPLIAHDLTVNALDRGVICGSQVPKVLEEWRHPRHEAFAPRTLWSWFNAVTEVVKGNLGMLPGRTQRLHQLCDACVGWN